MKKIFTVLLVLILLCSAYPFAASGAGGAKLVAITFDDGPSKYTATLLDGLKARGAYATFFCVGYNASAYPKTLKRMVDEGHQIANHTSTHPELPSLSSAGIQKEIANCNKYLAAAAGNQTFYLRPPYGSYNKTVRNVCGSPIILWSVDTLDWKYRNANTVYNNIINNTKDGSIILLHDLYKTSVDGALRAIDTLQGRGYEFVTVKELLRRRGITPQNGTVYSSAPNKGINLPALNAVKKPTVTVSNTVGGKTVSLSTETKDAVIYYTTDGSNPTTASTKYSGAFLLSKTATLKAVANLGGTYSEVVGQSVSVPAAPRPTVTNNGNTLTLSIPAGVAVYYTTDGSNPTTASAIYTTPFTASTTTKFLVRASGAADTRLTYTFTPHGDLFSDVDAGAWYYTAVGEAVKHQLMVGTATHVFDPDQPVTRATFVTVLSRISGADTSAAPQSKFTDVPQNSWYTAAVNWAASEGIVYGISDTQYAPDKVLTREEMCTMLHRFLEKYNYDFPKGEATPFTDAASISEWAAASVTAIQQIGLVSGMGNGLFGPKQTATRAQCARIFVSLHDLMTQYQPTL